MNPSNDNGNCNKPWKNQKSKINYYCINCLYSFRIIKKLQAHEKVFKNNDYCYLRMPDESDKILSLTKMKNLSQYHLLFIQILFLYSETEKKYNKSKHYAVIQYSHRLPLILKEINIFTTEVNFAQKSFVKITKGMQMK